MSPNQGCAGVEPWWLLRPLHRPARSPHHGQMATSHLQFLITDISYVSLDTDILGSINDFPPTTTPRKMIPVRIWCLQSTGPRIHISPEGGGGKSLSPGAFQKVRTIWKCFARTKGSKYTHFFSYKTSKQPSLPDLLRCHPLSLLQFLNATNDYYSQ